MGAGITLRPPCTPLYMYSVALFHMDEFEAAKGALEEGARLDPANKQYKTWLRKCQAELDGARRGGGAASSPIGPHHLVLPPRQLTLTSSRTAPLVSWPTLFTNWTSLGSAGFYSRRHYPIVQMRAQAAPPRNHLPARPSQLLPPVPAPPHLSTWRQWLLLLPGCYQWHLSRRAVCPQPPLPSPSSRANTGESLSSSRWGEGTLPFCRGGGRGPSPSPSAVGGGGAAPENTLRAHPAVVSPGLSPPTLPLPPLLLLVASPGRSSAIRVGEDKGQGGPIYASKPVPPPPPAPRHQYYQLQNKVTVDVYAKNIAKEAVSCDFSETHVTFTIRDAAGEEEYKLDVELYGKVWKRVGVKGEGERRR